MKNDDILKRAVKIYVAFVAGVFASKTYMNIIDDRADLAVLYTIATMITLIMSWMWVDNI